jgi:alcohol dehydrogenase (cytochrome c)
MGDRLVETGHTPDETGEIACPDSTGGTNFWPPTFDPSTRTFFVNARKACMTFYAWKPDYKAGERFMGGAGRGYKSTTMPVYGALRAIAPVTGERKWEFKYLNPSTAGLLTPASGLIFSGDNDGNPLALDFQTSTFLWRRQMGANLHGTSAITCMVDGRQHVLVPAGTTLTAWALPE